jgi:hypothetical protein
VAAVHEQHVGAARRERAGDRPGGRAVGAGDEGHLAVEAARGGGEEVFGEGRRGHAAMIQAVPRRGKHPSEVEPPPVVVQRDPGLTARLVMRCGHACVRGCDA